MTTQLAAFGLFSCLFSHPPDPASHLIGTSLLRQRAENDAALVWSSALYLPLDVENVLAAERHDRVTCGKKKKKTPLDVTVKQYTQK